MATDVDARDVDAIVVGSGPNGLAAAIRLAQAGCRVVVFEATSTIGGACRSAELTEPGVVHDLGSAIHPLGAWSPFFASLDLAAHGLEWVTPPAGAAHPLDGGRAAVAWNDLDRTADGLGRDGTAYRRWFGRWVDDFESIVDLTLHPLLRVPRDPVAATRFGVAAALPAAALAQRLWEDEPARALFAGHAAHAILPLERPFTAAFGVLLGAAVHAGRGWPFPRGGAQSLADALAAELRGLGGTIVVDQPITDLTELPADTPVIFTQPPEVVARIGADQWPSDYRRALRAFRRGPAAWKVDWSLDGPVPWTNPDVAHAGTVHVGGTLTEIARAERLVAGGRPADAPFVLVAQHTPFDPSRAPAGVHTVWAYAHVPNGCTIDQTDEIERQIERFAPGFRDRIRQRHVSGPIQLEAQNPNLLGGDVGGGSYAGRQIMFRPRPQLQPFDTPLPHVFLGSASTTPGAGVHGMAGVGAAERVLDRVLG